MTDIRQHINTNYLALFLMSVLNLLFLHFQFKWTIDLEIPYYTTSPIDNFLACLLDVTVLLALFWLLTFRKLKVSLVLTFVITLTWSFCNVFYSRFFLQYLTWSSIGQAGNLTEGIVIDSMWEGFRMTDLYYPAAATLFCWIFFHSKKKDITTKSLQTTLYIWGLTLCLGLLAHSAYFFHPSTGFVEELRKTIFTSPKMNSMWPNWTVFHKGFFRKMVIEPLTTGGKLKLTPEEKDAIEKEYTNLNPRITGRTAPANVKNVIFILVESYLACTSDLVVDGQEITPNLNRLKHDSATYYNGHVQPNVSIGESSDGQLIYMAGLLPLHSEITVSKARNIKLFGLPAQLKTAYPDLKSYTLIPTNPSLWDQQTMTEGYGFDKLYSSIEYHKIFHDNEGTFLSDDMVFQFASKLDEAMTPPFCSLILTMDMHMPYTSQIEHGFHLTDKNLPEKYRNYLVNCHYTDIQIGKYLENLKEKGLYDNSLIIIASDHDAHPTYLDMEGKITREIPIYIVNGGINKTKAWDGPCNQLDIYTTILDIMGIKSKWHGLGHTLLHKNYQNSVTDNKQEVSDWIIYSDYFGKTKE